MGAREMGVVGVVLGPRGELSEERCGRGAFLGGASESLASGVAKQAVEQDDDQHGFPFLGGAQSISFGLWVVWGCRSVVVVHEMGVAGAVLGPRGERFHRGVCCVLGASGERASQPLALVARR